MHRIRRFARRSLPLSLLVAVLAPSVGWATHPASSLHRRAQPAGVSPIGVPALVEEGAPPTVDPVGGSPAPVGDTPVAASPAAPVGRRMAPASGGRPVGAGTGVWAVVIGIDDYPGSSGDLRAAVADTDQATELLDRLGSPPSQRRVLTNEQARPEAVLDALDWLVDNAGPASTAIVFYAGHARTTNGRQFLVSATGARIADATLAAHLERLAAGRTWIVMSSCHAGGFDELLAPGRILTGGAPAGELAYESSSYRYSYLVEYLIHRGLLEGRAAPSIHAAFDWARRQLDQDHPGRAPVQYQSDTDDLRLALRSLTPAAARNGEAPNSGEHPQPAPPSSEPDRCQALTMGAIACGP